MLVCDIFKLMTYQCLISLIHHSLGNCQAGYYCPLGQTEANPTVFICTPGHYCEEGSGTPTQCPIGTFSNATGNSNVTDCKPCTAGKPQTKTMITVDSDCHNSIFITTCKLFCRILLRWPWSGGWNWTMHCRILLPRGSDHRGASCLCMSSGILLPHRKWSTNHMSERLVKSSYGKIPWGC
jgi:hypothetical protein